MTPRGRLPRRAAHCLGGGFYVDGSGRDRGFVVGEKSGTWNAAKEAFSQDSLYHLQ